MTDDPARGAFLTAPQVAQVVGVLVILALLGLMALQFAEDVERYRAYCEDELDQDDVEVHFEEGTGEAYCVGENGTRINVTDVPEEEFDRASGEASDG